MCVFVILEIVICHFRIGRIFILQKKSFHHVIYSSYHCSPFQRHHCSPFSRLRGSLLNLKIIIKYNVLPFLCGKLSISHLVYNPIIKLLLIFFLHNLYIFLYYSLWSAYLQGAFPETFFFPSFSFHEFILIQQHFSFKFGVYNFHPNNSWSLNFNQLNAFIYWF